MNKNKIAFSLVAVVVIAIAVFLSIPNQEEIQDTELGHRHFIADFDYMIAAMEESFPFFGVTYRMLGFDIHELAAEVRVGLVNNPNMDGLDFARYISENFIMPFEHLAHIDLLPFDAFYYFDLNFNTVDPYFFGNPLATFTNPDFEFEPLRFPINPDTLVFEREMIETYILEEGRIAYINFPTLSHIFIPHFQHDLMRSTVFDFIASLEGYEHLIVDIRETHGGYLGGFVNSIIRPNIDEPHQNIGFAFHTAGSHPMFVAELHKFRNPAIQFQYLIYYPEEMSAADLLQAALRRFAETAHTPNEFVNNMIDPDAEFERTTAAEIVEQYNLVYMNQEDLTNLAYGFRVRTHVAPDLTAPAFGGQIWLLTAPNNFSASEAVARLAKDTGVAILVGETTGGAVGGGATSQIRLPNTSLILRWDTIYFTDSYGRALEEIRTTPHFKNRPDLDALETVLDIINEISEIAE
ncbi:MAG: S41 family peptidase [Defluviitaleaceae bacterium]|nr:S41 family peptidase [Defluviitaleaceae bacterium]